MKEISTWGGKSKFTYDGSVNKGTKIVFKSGVVLKFSKDFTNYLIKDEIENHS